MNPLPGHFKLYSKGDLIEVISHKWPSSTPFGIHKVMYQDKDGVFIGEGSIQTYVWAADFIDADVADLIDLYYNGRK